MVTAEEMIEFIKKEVPPPWFTKITLDTDLHGDLRMYWEDAHELLELIFNYFKINEGDFDFSKYYPDEGSFFIRKPYIKPKPLRIRMLLNAANAGVWKEGEV